MKFEVLILGNSSGLPVNGRFTSMQILDLGQKLFLIDCGEGAQMQLAKYKVKENKIEKIFITHLHGDHYFGLPGLLNSFSLKGRTKKLEVFSPEGLKDIMKIIFEKADAKINYPLVFHDVSTSSHKLIAEDSTISIFSIPLKHRIPTTGFLFKEKKRQRKIIPKKIEEYNIPFDMISDIKSGAGLKLKSGKVIKNEELTLPPPNSRSYAYCSDTKFFEKVIDIVKGVDLLYHEATFLDNLREKATETKHSTVKDAATIAKRAKVGKLIIGHFSSRYKELQPLLAEAKTIFENTELAIGGKRFLCK